MLLLIFGGEDFTENPAFSDDHVDSNDKTFLIFFRYLAAAWYDLDIYNFPKTNSLKKQTGVIYIRQFFKKIIKLKTINHEKYPTIFLFVTFAITISLNKQETKQITNANKFQAYLEIDQNKAL